MEPEEIGGGEDDVGGDFSEFMSSIEASMFNMMKETAKAPEDAYEHWQAFSSAVDWSETWIRVLLSFHFILLTVVFLTRRNVDIQCALFMIICILTVMSERVNEYCATHWISFAKQNYFDKHGVFAGIMYAGPLLMIALFQLLNFLVLSSSALIKFKKMELAHKMKGDKKVKAVEKTVQSQTAANERVSSSKSDS